mmetsp:Transcript_16001/g.18574  ORF Transcript_16001/g.18574 Transcript_16001/m.18574 type:complete len:86 (+) Transcript_16001:153-410(+)
MSVLNSLKIASTVTGSVAEISELKAKDSRQVKCGVHPVSPNTFIMSPSEIMAMNVPKNANIRIVPKFFKKLLLFHIEPRFEDDRR